jgi:hypothetical protein
MRDFSQVGVVAAIAVMAACGGLVMSDDEPSVQGEPEGFPAAAGGSASEEQMDLSSGFTELFEADLADDYCRSAEVQCEDYYVSCTSTLAFLASEAVEGRCESALIDMVACGLEQGIECGPRQARPEYERCGNLIERVSTCIPNANQYGPGACRIWSWRQECGADCIGFAMVCTRTGDYLTCECTNGPRRGAEFTRDNCHALVDLATAECG